MFSQDFKLNLQESDYGATLANETSITPPVIEGRALNKLVQEFFFMRAQAVEPLATFLDYITFEYMIENVMLLLRGTLSGRNVNDLMAQCHPLGMFRESTMRNIPSFEASPRGYAELYETVLVDTPVGVISNVIWTNKTLKCPQRATCETFWKRCRLKSLRTH
jgi:V-type H+-transporting ATPase subunit d